MTNFLICMRKKTCQGAIHRSELNETLYRMNNTPAITTSYKYIGTLESDNIFVLMKKALLAQGMRLTWAARNAACFHQFLIGHLERYFPPTRNQYRFMIHFIFLINTNEIQTNLLSTLKEENNWLCSSRLHFYGIINVFFNQVFRRYKGEWIAK